MKLPLPTSDHMQEPVPHMGCPRTEPAGHVRSAKLFHDNLIASELKINHHGRTEVRLPSSLLRDVLRPTVHLTYNEVSCFI
jgi:hypothetical protein